VLSLGALTLILIAALLAAVLPSRHSSSCPKSESAHSGCDVWWGAALNVNDSALPNGVAALEDTTGRRLDIVHTYHRWDDVFPTTAERALAQSGHELFLNWEPTERSGAQLSWGAIAAGAQDAVIDAEAKRLATLPAVLVSFSHEPELDFHEHGGSPADFAAAFRHVHDRVIADGATNVSWVWVTQGLSDPVWLQRYQVMWPGNAYVDWVAWDPYNWGSCRGRAWASFQQTVAPFYNWLEAHGFGAKPFMLAEYGSVEKANDSTGKADWYAGIPSALKSLPNLRALVYFDLPAPPANCNWQITTSTDAQTAFGRLAESASFARTATLDPDI
jgi:hypothetical protein